MDHYELDFEWDEAKSAANLAKHGIDFYEVRELWDGYVYERRADCLGELRFLCMGRIGGEYWTVVYAPRAGRRRIVSARRSTGTERSAYDRANNG